MSTEKEVTLQDVRHMAMLSRLAIDETEERVFARQFGQILGHMSVLESVDTVNLEPMYSPVVHPGLTREDRARKVRERSQILANAPETDGESFVVPRIV